VDLCDLGVYYDNNLNVPGEYPNPNKNPDEVDTVWIQDTLNVLLDLGHAWTSLKLIGYIDTIGTRAKHDP